MPAPPTLTEVLDDIYVSTLAAASRELFDQVFGIFPFWRDLRERGNAEPQVGGKQIQERLLYGKNETITWLGRGGTVSMSDSDIATVGLYNWTKVAGNVSRISDDDDINKGKVALRNLLSDKIEVLKKSMAEEMERVLFGSASGENEMNGLGSIIEATVPASQTTTGGTTNLSKATYSWWRNQFTAATGAAPAWLLSDMSNLANNCSKGQETEVPNYIITTQAIHEILEQELLAKPYRVAEDKRDLGITKIFWRGIPIIYSSYCPTGYMYFLNLMYLKLRFDPAKNFAPTAWKEIYNTPFDKVMQVVWRGQLTSRNCSRLGVMTGISMS